MSAQTIYLDSSALVKLVIEEAESAALATMVAGYPGRTSSVLAAVEVSRAVRRGEFGDGAIRRVEDLLARTVLIEFSGDVLELARQLDPPGLGSLDAIHLAFALSVGDDLAGMVVYDRLLAEAAAGTGLPVLAPA